MHKTIKQINENLNVSDPIYTQCSNMWKTASRNVNTRGQYKIIAEKLQ